jgi:serine/threonine protein kinase
MGDFHPWSEIFEMHGNSSDQTGSIPFVTQPPPSSSWRSLLPGIFSSDLQVAVTMSSLVSGFVLFKLYRLFRRQLPPQPPSPPPPPPPSPSPGPRSQDSLPPSPPTYTLIRQLGRGGFGTVHMARHNTTGVIVAIKQSNVMTPAEMDALQKEYELVFGLENANVVKVLGFERDRDCARLYLEWCAGGSLSQLIQQIEISESLLRSYTRQILSGLKFLHDRRILHRDIKPGNILIDHTGSLKLTDFGLSRHAESLLDVTRACGTVPYMAPECISGLFSVGSDIWAVGATMTEMVSKLLPWSHLDQNIRLNQIALALHIGQNRGNPLNHPRIPVGLSAEAKSFLETCFQQDPSCRGTCDSLLNHPFLHC